VSGAGKSPRPRDFLLTLGVALVVVGFAAVIAAFVRGEPEDAGLSALMLLGGVMLWRWRRAKLG
jgi:hypothetical protein